jgi:hypothetical protein
MLTGMSSKEKLAYDHMRQFCAGILKTLAPPLFQEVESTKLSAEADPFTPKRRTRSASASPLLPKPRKKASAAETALLKALGITPADLDVDDASLEEFRKLFDSPL